MSNDLISLEMQPRTVLGKKVKARRSAGMIPGNIVMKGQPSLAVEIPLKALLKTMEQAGYTQALELVVGKKKITALINGVSYEATRDVPQHIVFFEVKQGETVSASVPLTLTGDAPGTQKGLIVLQMLYSLEVRASALRIPEQLEVDISRLEENGDVVRIDDLQLPPEVEVEIDLQTPIVRLEVSRSQVSQEAETEEETEEGESEEGEASTAEGEESEPADQAQEE